MIKKLFAFFLPTFIFFACTKPKDPVTPPAVIPEKLEINPVSNSIIIGATAIFTIKYFNTTGTLAPTPSNIVWTSSNSAIASVNAQGVATAISEGQITVKATYNSTFVTALLTVVSNPNQLATITLVPNDIKEITLNGTSTIGVEGKNNAGGLINGLTYSWASNTPNTVSINSNGLVTGLAYGTANITASSFGISSAPLMVQVIRTGNFSGQASMGSAKLKIEGGVLKLQTSSNFSVSTGAPDLRIYLSNSTNVTGALQVATLTQRTGAQSWNIAAPTTITQYRYVIVWCAQFGGNYGTADLGL